MGKLGKELLAFKGCMADRVGPEAQAVVEASDASLLAAGVGRDAPALGEIAPDFELPDQDGTIHALKDLLADGPAVLLFIRGAWCPFSEIVLRAYDKIAPRLRRMGARMAAVTPSTQDQTHALVERNRLSFPVLFDRDNGVARAWRLAYSLPEPMRGLFERLDHPLPRMNGTDTWELPCSATFVIAPDGRVAAVQVDPRKMVRMEPAEALAAVQAIVTPESVAALG
jgi:peroxiredoxin